MKNMKKGLLHMAIILAVVAFFAVTVFIGLGRQHKGSANNILLGLDLAGGVSITYETVDSVSASEMSDTVYKLQKRAESYNTESQVYQEGDNRINVDIPGVEDSREALKKMGSAGALYFVSNTVYQEAYEKYKDDITTNDAGQTVFPDGAEFSSVVCDGKDISTAKANTQKDQTTGVTENVVNVSFNGTGANKFAEASTYAYENGNEPIHIIYDNIVISSPNVRAAITNGECQISGGFETYEEADELATTIRIGALPIELKVLRWNVVGAKLGAEAIETSLIAALIGFCLLVVFMIAYYRIPGLAASIALVFYIGAVMLAINGLDVTLTLPGIAGVILSVGMAVDANVIIFTRIREELATGKTITSSTKIGFEKATSAIVDGNVTTLIAAAVLWFLGSGTVKGFAQTLAIGIVLSMFTALFVTKIVLGALYNLGATKEGLYGVQKPVKVFNFVKNKTKYFAISGAMFAICIIALIVNYSTIGSVLNYGLDFVGGSATQITFDAGTTIDADVKSGIEKIFKSSTGTNECEINDVEGENAILVKTKELSLDENDAVVSALVASDYKIDEDNIQTENISATVSGEMKRDAIVSVIIASIFMLIYIWIRFKNLSFGAASVLALIHDVVVVLMVYAVFRTWISVGNTFIACMLTIVGYSINATIVVFDRIRENARSRSGIDKLAEVVNLSISQTISRSINTSLTTFFMVFMLVILGVDSVRQFAIPLMAGIVCGCYSSICIAGTLYYLFKTRFGKLVKDDAGKIEKAE